MSEARNDVTGLLRAWSAGDQRALDRLMPLVYDQLKRIARRQLRREPERHALQTTALVHDAYLQLVDQKRASAESRLQFFAAAAGIMRRLLVDQARARHAAKRGAGVRRVSLDDELTLAARDRDPELLALDSALARLEGHDPRQARVVELRYFGGLSVEDAAAALGVSPATVKREWAMAKAWLYRELAGQAR
jgi:RNA polymerase sigma-70 factor (ECF subfamily)